MIKLVIAMRRHPGMSPSAFRDYHSGAHVRALNSAAGFRRHITRYDQLQLLRGAELPVGACPAFEDRDAVVDLWFADLATLTAAFAEPDYAAVIPADQSKFTDPQDAELVSLLTERVTVYRSELRATYKLLEFVVPSAVESDDLLASWKSHCDGLLRAAPHEARPTALSFSLALPTVSGPWPASPYTVILEAEFDSVAALAAWERYRGKPPEGELALMDHNRSRSFAGEAIAIF